MVTTEDVQQEERRERALAVLRQMIADKREDERKAIEEYKTNPELQALISKLRYENANRGAAAKL